MKVRPLLAEFRPQSPAQGLWNNGEAQVFTLLLMEGFARFALYRLSTSLVPFRVQVVVLGRWWCLDQWCFLNLRVFVQNRFGFQAKLDKSSAAWANLCDS